MSLLDTASLIVTPNGYKEGKLYSVIPSDGSGDLSVTRATTATRVNSAGLVELVPYNLLEQSNSFNGSPWAAVATRTPNAAIAPDGTMTATRIQLASGGISYLYQGVPFSSGAKTISCYIKGATAQTIGFNDGNAVTNSINITTEWQRYTFTYNTNSGGMGIQFDNYFGVSPSQQAKDFYIWGAQLVEGSTAKDYQKTETRLNIPRLDYSNGTCPSLLVEPQRTNAVTYSEFFSAANGYNYQNASQSGSSIVSPSGLLAYGITSTTSANDFHRYYKTLSGRTGVNTTTIFAKKGTSRYLGLGVNQNGSTGNNNVVVFDLQNGVIASNTYGVTASIEDFGDGWYRLVHTFDYGTGGTYADICVHNTGTSTYTINAFQTFDSPSSPTTIYVWGLQMEAGSYATSYIPTTSASVTRNADVISKTGIGSLIGQTEGTLFVDAYIDIQNEELSPVVGLFALNNNASNLNNCIVIGIDRPASGTSNQIYGFVINGGTDQAILNSSNITAGRHKIAFAYKANDFVLYVNGVLIGSDTSGSVPTLSQALIGSRYNGDTYFLGDEVNSAALWKTRLTNTQLAQLTTI